MKKNNALWPYLLTAILLLPVAAAEDLTRDAALHALLQGERDMREMQDNGLGVQWVNDTLLEARRAFDSENATALLARAASLNNSETRALIRNLIERAEHSREGGGAFSPNYSLVFTATEAIHARKLHGLLLKDRLRAAELEAESLETDGLLTSDLGQLLHLTHNAFANERYTETGTLLDELEQLQVETRADATLTRAMYRASQDTLLHFTRKHWKPLFVFIILSTLLLLFFSNTLAILMTTRALTEMKAEETVLVGLLKNAQRDYYVTNSISRKTFDVKTETYMNRLREIRRTIPVITSRLTRLQKRRRLI